MKRKLRKLMIVLLGGLMITVLLLGNPAKSLAASTILSWYPSTINTDGTQLNDLAGYKVYYGTESGNYSGSIDVGNVVTYQVNDLLLGVTYFFAATAYDTTGNESQHSAEISKIIEAPLEDSEGCLMHITESSIDIYGCEGGL